tara:strand:+ start:212 stop:535 length:324 start_codon:yes stop_codon:yes gene_type:complete
MKNPTLSSYIRTWKTEEKLAIANVLLTHKTPEGEHEDISTMHLNGRIDDVKYEIHEKFCYKFYELIESKNANCSRSDAQRIANLLLEDLSFSKWCFLVDCVTGKIDS